MERPNEDLDERLAHLSTMLHLLEAMLLEHPATNATNMMEERSENYFVYTNETKEADIPKETLTHLRIDSSVTEIPVGAFQNCTALTHVRVDSSCSFTEISDNAFEDCPALTHVRLSETTIKRIGIRAFHGCHQLKCFQFGDGDISRNAAAPAPSSSLEILSCSNGTIVFPETLFQIDDFAFAGCDSLRKIIFCSSFVDGDGSTTTRLGKGVFHNCQGLNSVKLPEGLQVIDELLFRGCRSLTTVQIPSSVIIIGETAFWGCQSLRAVDLPHGLLEIGKLSFLECFALETLLIPSTVLTIGAFAFLQCSSLSHIRVPPSVERIVPRAFIAGSSLISIELAEETLVDETLLPTEQERFLDWVVRCRSLVNLAIPKQLPPKEEDDDYDDHDNNGMSATASGLLLHNKSRLGSVLVDDAADLTRKLNHRFDTTPLNKLCYYQSYHSLEDAMVQLHSLMEDDPFAATITQVDEFGMTPLHLLSLSQTPNLEMLLAVIDAGKPGHMVHCRDSFGSTPMDYLCLNRTANSAEAIRRVLQSRFDQVLGLDRSWKSALLQVVDEALAIDWTRRKSEISKVVRKYERKEILSLVELHLWKVKIDEVTEQIVDRQRCRIMSSAATVIPLVLPFLDKLDV
eukprot:scaffold1867_cov122-Cylindrotheca_fusiformis.AAC.4